MEKIWRKTEERAELHLSRKVIQLDPTKKSVLDNEGDEYTYDKLLLATGGSPNHLPFGNGNIIYYRNFQHYKQLRALTETGRALRCDRRKFYRFGDGRRADDCRQKSDDDLSAMRQFANTSFPVTLHIS